MNRGKLLATMCVTALALSPASVWAQRGDSSSGDRGSGTGSAVDRGSSSSSSPSPSSSGGSSAGSSSSTGSSSGSSDGGRSYSPSGSSPSASSGSDYVSVPVRPSEREQGGPRGGPRSGGDSGSRAVPRGSDGAAGSPLSTERRAGGGGSDSPSRNAVPPYSRPGDGRQGTGTAVDRPAGYYGGGSYPVYPSYPIYGYRYPGYYGSYIYPGYAFGLGYFYDPSWYDPYYYGGLYGGGYGGYYGSGDSGAYQGTGSSSYGRGPQGSLRLKIKPREGQVYVDGFFVGTVDDFDGTFQKLGIDAGGHRIEIKAPGHETISFEVLITSGETVTYKGELPRVQ
jgi:PEGA domain